MEKSMYPMRKYPIKSLGGPYIHTSFSNYQNTLNNYESDIQYDSNTMIRIKIMELLKKDSIRKENKIVAEMRVINPTYALLLENKLDNKKINTIDEQLHNIFINIDNSLDNEEIFRKALNSNKENILTKRNLANISKIVQDNLKKIMVELSEIDIMTPNKIKNINKNLRAEAASYQKEAKLFKQGEINYFDVNSINSIKNMAKDYIEKEREILMSDILKEMQSDFKKGEFRESYSAKKDLNTGNIRASFKNGKPNLKNDFLAAMKEAQESPEFKERMFEKPFFKYVYGNTARFQSNKVNSGRKVQKELDKIYGEVMASMLLPFLSVINKNEKYFFFSGDKIVKRSELIEEMIQEQMLYKTDFFFNNKMSNQQKKIIDKAKQSSTSGKYYGSDEAFYKIRQPAQAQYFNSLSANYASLFEINLEER